MELHHEDEQPALWLRPRGIRLRVGVGAAVVLVLVAAALAVLISATASRPASATTAAYSSGGSAKTSSTDDDSASSGSSSTSSSAGTVADAGSGVGAAAGATAFVQVVGQVQKPGLYELPAGDRIVDAVAAAGGFSAKADQASLNLAQVIADGQQIVVGAKGAGGAVSSSGAGVGSAGATGSAQVDINTADETGLETLDGIGPALAARILAYRTAHGGFRSVGDLQNVTGIGPKKFAAIKSSVSV